MFTQTASHVGTHEIKVDVEYPSGTKLSTGLTIKLIITDPCDSATVTKGTIADATWEIGATAKDITFAKFTLNPTSCDSKITYKLTIPTALSEIATASSDGLKLTLNGSTRKTGDAAAHDIVFGAYGPAGPLLTSGSVTFKLTITEKAGETTTTTGTTVTATKGPIGQGPSAQGTVKQLSSVVSVGASAFASVKAAGPPKVNVARNTGGARPSGGKPAGSTGGKSGSGSASFDGGSGSSTAGGEPSGPAGGDSTSAGGSEAGGESGGDNFDSEGDSTSPEFAGVDFSL